MIQIILKHFAEFISQINESSLNATELLQVPVMGFKAKDFQA